MLAYAHMRRYGDTSIRRRSHSQERKFSLQDCLSFLILRTEFLFIITKGKTVLTIEHNKCIFKSKFLRYATHYETTVHYNYRFGCQSPTDNYPLLIFTIIIIIIIIIFLLEMIFFKLSSSNAAKIIIIYRDLQFSYYI